MNRRCVIIVKDEPRGNQKLAPLDEEIGKSKQGMNNDKTFIKSSRNE